MEFKADRKAAALGDDFLEGGLDYLRARREQWRLLRMLDPNTFCVNELKLPIDKNGDHIDKLKVYKTNTHPKTSDRIAMLEKLKSGDLH